MMLAFLAVALAAVALVTAAALIGTGRGLAAQQDAERSDLASRVAAAAADAYRTAGGWDGADLGPALTLSTAGNARLVVRDPSGGVVAGTQPGRGQGTGNGNGTGSGTGSGAGNGSGSTAGMGQGQGSGQGSGVGLGGGTTLTAPVVTAGSTVGSVTLVFPRVTQLAGQPIAWTWVGVAAVIAAASAVGAAWWLSNRLTRPLTALTATARAFATGDRDARTGLPPSGEFGELATAFDDAATQVQLSERARRQMSADVAHELRTPLAALQAGLEELRDGLIPADPAALGRLHDQSLRLGRVVTDLAELSAADAARLTIRPQAVNLAAVASQAADAHEAPLRAAGITLTRQLDTEVMVSGDAGRLHQVVANLLQNCARHCREGDTVSLRAEPVPSRAVVLLTVTDTGPGIPPQDLPHVFTRFWRSVSGGGSGLGLPIVRAIVEAHHGTVTAQSDGRRGTRMTVELPLLKLAGPARSDAPAAPGRGRAASRPGDPAR